MKQRSPTAIAFILTLASLAPGQTFDLDKGTSSTASKEHKQSQAGSGDSATQSLGWGSSIEVARQARAAQDALKQRRLRRGRRVRPTSGKSRPAKRRPLVPARIFCTDSRSLSTFVRCLQARAAGSAEFNRGARRSGRNLRQDGPRRGSPTTVDESRRGQS